MADWIAEFDPEDRSELVEKTADERFAQVERLDRRDDARLDPPRRRAGVSRLGRRARRGLARARREYEDASPQHIRITRGFLIENPEVAGRSGLGLNLTLLDDSPSNGELHPEGVVLRGGRMLEIRLVAEGADEDDPPASRYVAVVADSDSGRSRPRSTRRSSATA